MEVTDTAESVTPADAGQKTGNQHNQKTQPCLRGKRNIMEIVALAVSVVTALALLIALLSLNRSRSKKPYFRRFNVVPQSHQLMPERAHPDDAGMDMRLAEDVYLRPGQRHLASLGVKGAVPQGCVGLLVPRSGLAHKHGLSIVNSPGIVDAGYTGLIKANLINLGDKAITLHKGERVAQMVILPLVPLTVHEVDILEATARGAHGHGSTGAA